MFRYIDNERGALFPVAVALLFIFTLFISMYLAGFYSQLKTYNSLELVNVRATISILVEMGNSM